MEFRILGPLEVSGGEGPLALGGARQRAVLAHLVLRANHVVPADLLIDELWGEEPPETARNTVQTYVYRLRGILGQDRIGSQAPGYVLRLKDGELDVRRFEALAAEARADLLEDPVAAVGTLAEALELWRGAALADLAEEPSLAGEIARLEELRLSAIEDKLSAELALGRHSAVVGELESLTRRYPLRERLWGDLMLALYRSGRQAEALEAFQQARSVLAEELGIDPSRRLQRLHEQILAQDPGLSVASMQIPVVEAPRSSAPGELAPDTMLAGYRIEDLLGRGGMSTVYLAEDARLRRRVALKVLSPVLSADERFRGRFVRESQIAAGMEHPNIVPIYEAGEADGLLFIAMRYVRGTDLGRLIAGAGRLEPERALQILRDVASALDAAHAEGLVHRDVKPANILLIEGAGADGRDVVYLSDFGLTKRLEAESGGLTKTGQFVGTVDYVAPEQIEGKAVDGRADEYSLGCVLFECLTGIVPFVRETQVAALYAHLSEKPPRMSVQRPELPVGLDRVVGTALAKASSQRFGSCGELIAAARSNLVSAEGGSGPRVAPARRARGPWAAVAAIAVVATAAVGLALVRDAGEAADPTDGGTPSPTPSASTTSEPNFATSERPLTSDEERLLTYVPERVAAACEPFDTTSGNALGGLVCADEGVEVLYQLFADRESMDSALQLNANIQGATGGECATDGTALTPYTIGGLPAGRVLCYRTESVSPGDQGIFTVDPRSDLEWTDERLLVYGHAVRNDAADLSLYEWWLAEAGPEAPSGAEVVAKDRPAGAASPPDGSFLLALSARDVERSGLDRVGGTKGVVGQFTWDGTWALRVADGEYELVHDAAGIESGTYELQKPLSMLFDARFGDCQLDDENRQIAYTWSATSSTVTWERQGGGCAGPQPLTGIPWLEAPRGTLAAGSALGGLSTTDPAGLGREPLDPEQLPVGYVAQPVWSPDGSAVAFVRGDEEDFDVFVMDADGSNVRQLTDLPGDQLDPAWSPDGSRLAFSDADGLDSGSSDLSVVNADGSGLTTLVDEVVGFAGRPAWSPDGTRIAFTIWDGRGVVHLVGADGSALTEVYAGSDVTSDVDWTSDGEGLLIADSGPQGYRLISIALDGTQVRSVLDRLSPALSFPVFSYSPDGRWIVVSDGWYRGLTQGNFPMWLISADGEHVFHIRWDFEPSWRPGRA